MNTPTKNAIDLHRALKGKIEIHNRVSIDAGFGDEEKGTLGLIYTPGVTPYLLKMITRLHNYNNALYY